MSAAIGWVDGSWSCRYAQILRELQKLVHDSVYWVAAADEWWAAHSAKDSLSQRSSHQRIVTRSPNHMCAISWRIVFARPSYAARVCRLR